MTLIFTESFDGYAGTGLAPAATQTTQSTGTLNSNVWLITGMSDAQPGYGGTVGTGDYGRGLFPASSNTTTGGAYAATVGAGRGLGFQPTGTDFAEGANSYVTLRLANTTGATWQDITVNFDWIWRNNDGRSETMNFSYSTDGTNFTTISAAQLVTGVASDGTNLFQSNSQALTLTGASVANNGFLYLRWAHTASSGSGGRDEVGIDNVSVNVADSGASNVTINDVSIVEGDSGTSILTFTVTRSTNEGAFTVDYATASDTASDASDFAAASGTVSFTQGGDLTQTVSITINGDLDIEAAEQFFVNLSNVVNTTGVATVTDGQGIGTITNDDFPPTVSISDAGIVEGDNGQSYLVFTVTRTDENSEFSVEWATQNGTASMSSDYNGDLGEIFFTQGGALSQTISIAVNGDTLAEADETLTVVLSSINNTVGSTTIADDTGAGVILNDDVTKIYEIQGAGHTSAMNGQQVTTIGVVTAIDKDGNGYWIQDATGDGNRDTSDGIYVFTSTPVGPEIVVGNLIRVSATVSEFAPGGAANLTLTELVTVTATTVLATNQTLPTAVIIGDTANGADVTPALHTLGSTTDGYDPVNDGVDFWESLEGMRVTLQDFHTTSPFKSSFGEVVGTMDVGANNSLNSRGGLTISDDSPNGTLPADKSFDFNPERIQLDDEALGGSIGNITSVGQTVVGDDVTGIVSYGQGFYDVNVTQAVVFDPSTLVKETTTLQENLDRLTVATFNVRNLAPLGFNGGDGVTTQTTLDNLSDAITGNLNSPDIIGLQEMQDFNGVTGGPSNGGSDATLTMSQLIATIYARTGIQYYGILSDPVDDQEGGASGGNIQVAFLYLPTAVTPTAANNLVETSPGSHIFKFPTADRIGEDADPNFAATRSSIPIEFLPAGYTETQGGSFWVINNHFSSKGGSAVMIGSNLDSEYYAEPLNSDSVKREAQAMAVKVFIDGILNDANPLNDKIIALGDFNDFQIFPVIELITGEIQRTIAGSGSTPSTFVTGEQVLKALIELLPPEERYSYNFDGNAQALDNIIASLDLLVGAQYDIVHINSEFATQLSDHDPGITSLLFARSAAIATEGADVFTAASYLAKFGAARGDLTGDDTVYALGGDDLIEGSAGADYLSGGGGFDTVDYTGSDAAVTVNLTTNTASGGWAAGDTLIGIENLTGSAFDDFLTGSATINVLNGGLGADTMAGGGNNDSYYVDNAGDVVTDTAGAADIVYSSISYTLVDAANANLTGQIEHLTLTGTDDIDGTGNAVNNTLRGNVGANTLDGGAGVDQIFGDAGDDHLIGGEGNDILDGGAGADEMEGGAGYDTYLVDEAGDTITETSTGGFDTVKSTAGSYVLGDYLETLTLVGAGAQDGTGNAQANTINGNNFNNVLNGAAGADILNGNAGNDDLNGGDDNDKLYGGAAADDLVGGAGNDLLDGGTGNDDMAGGAGNDTYYVDSASDSVVETAGEGTLDKVFVSAAAFALSADADIEIIQATNAGGATITGSSIANKIYGTDGADTFDGLGGADYLAGGLGTDTLTGGEGNDILDGGAGDDIMVGGLGIDTYYVDSFSDSVTENADEGVDTVRTTLDGYGLGDNLENLILTGVGNQDGTGNALNNTLTGNDDNNSLDGGDGNDRLVGNDGSDDLYGGAGIDTLLGGAGDDLLYGGAGNDKLTGGTGRDYFSAAGAINPVLSGAIETDSILDLEAGEVIGLGVGELHFQSVFNGTAGQAKLVYTASSNSTLFQLDVNGDNKVDYQLRLNGDQTANTHIATDENDVGGGWYLFGATP